MAEFLGTFAFVLISSGVVLADIFYGEIGRLGIGLSIGFSYGALVFITAHLSGGYLNPAITLSLWLAQKLPGLRSCVFILLQIFASFLAAIVLFYIFGQNSLQLSLGGPILGVNVNAQIGVAVEAILTSILIFAVFGTMIDRGGPVSFGPLVLGFILTATTILALPISGAAMNPARAIGPLVLSRNFESLVIWIVGPAAGSLFGLVYDLLFIKKFKKS